MKAEIKGARMKADPIFRSAFYLLSMINEESLNN